MARLLRGSGTIAGGVSQTELDAFVGTTNIATLGTVGTGTWEGTDVGVAHGGTGASTLTANYALLGNGTSAPQMIAPGSDGHVLTSTGSTWGSEAAAGGGVDGITSSADANAITIDSSERVILKAQPMMLATGNGEDDDRDVTGSYATVTELTADPDAIADVQAADTARFLRGITFSSGVAEVPIAGKYFISAGLLIGEGLTDQDHILFKLEFSGHERKEYQNKSSLNAHYSFVTGIFEMAASENVRVQVQNGTAARGKITNSKHILRMSMVYIGE